MKDVGSQRNKHVIQPYPNHCFVRIFKDRSPRRDTANKYTGYAMKKGMIEPDALLIDPSE